jgi:hypothetical protein
MEISNHPDQKYPGDFVTCTLGVQMAGVMSIAGHPEYV